MNDVKEEEEYERCPHTFMGPPRWLKRDKIAPGSAYHGVESLSRVGYVRLWGNQTSSVFRSTLDELRFSEALG